MTACGLQGFTQAMQQAWPHEWIESLYPLSIRTLYPEFSQGPDPCVLIPHPIPGVNPVYCTPSTRALRLSPAPALGYLYCKTRSWSPD